MPNLKRQRTKKIDEAMEDAGTARLVARAKKQVSEGMPLIPKDVVDRLVKACEVAKRRRKTNRRGKRR